MKYFKLRDVFKIYYVPVSNARIVVDRTKEIILILDYLPILSNKCITTYTIKPDKLFETMDLIDNFLTSDTKKILSLDIESVNI